MGRGFLIGALTLGAQIGLDGQVRQPQAVDGQVGRTETVTQTIRTESWSTTTSFGISWGEKSNEKKLAERGPTFAPLFSMSEFDIIAFAKGEWPAVLDYELSPGSVGFLMVFSDGIDPFYFRLGGLGRQLQTFALPQRFGAKPRISRYSIRVWQDQPGATAPAPFSVYGIGAGPRAVGSVNIDQLRFTPALVHAGQDKAEYSFRAKKPFDRVEADFVRVGLARLGGPIYAQSVGAKEHRNVKQEVPFRDTWDGRPGKEFKPLNKQDRAEGQFKLNVRAWLKSEKEGDWLAAWSDDIVEIRRTAGK
jgi:hypothetical protein